MRTETDGLQSLLGTTFPVHGLLSGSFHGAGTRDEPQLNALFDIISPEIFGWKFDRARGEFSLDQGELRIANAELRLCRRPPAAQAALPADCSPETSATTAPIARPSSI